MLAFTPAVRAQIDPQTALLERAGWDALAADQPHAAAQAFAQALARDGANPRVHLGAATAAFLERRDDDARRLLERALTLDDGLAPARALLGVVLHRQGDLAGAIRTYERLVADAPDDRQAGATLERWKREAALHDRLQETVGTHFTVAFEGPSEVALADRALDGLERAYWRIGAVLSAYPIAPIPVVLYTTEQFRDITRAPTWAAGAFDGTIRVPVRDALASPRELDRVLAHEFTHALARSLAPRGVPAWLDEGLAAALESGDVGWAEVRVRRAGGVLPLTRLVTGFGSLPEADAQLAYATSAIAVRRLIADHGGFAVTNLLRDLGDGADFDAAFAHRMQQSVAEFEASLATP